MEEEVRIIPDELYEEIVCQTLEEDYQRQWAELYQEWAEYEEARNMGWE